MIKYRITQQNGSYTEFLDEGSADIYQVENGGAKTQIEFEPTTLLSILIEEKLKAFDKDTTDYIYSKYPAPSQQSYCIEMVYAMFNNQTNKMAKIASIRSWAGTVLDYHFSLWAQIEAAESKEELDAISWDFSPFDITDPQVSLRDVLMMND